MSRLLLHIGMPKTGTTTIQETLGENHAWLKERGVFYPPQKPFNHSNNFTQIFMEHPENTISFRRSGISGEAEVKEKIKELTTYWEKLFQNQPVKVETFVVSAENLIKLNKKGIVLLQGFLSQYFSDIEVIVYVRRPDHFIKSNWEQAIKTLDPGIDGSLLLDRVISSVNFKCIDDWANTFGKENIKIRPFDPQCFENGCLITDFCIHSGIPMPKIVGSNSKNRSLGCQAVGLLYEYNRSFPLFRGNGFNPERGLTTRANIFYDILAKVDDQKLAIDIKYTALQAEKLNHEILVVNRYLPDSQEFDYVSASDEETFLPDYNSISKSYVVDLINEYNKLIDKLLE